MKLYLLTRIYSFIINTIFILMRNYHFAMVKNDLATKVTKLYNKWRVPTHRS